MIRIDPKVVLHKAIITAWTSAMAITLFVLLRSFMDSWDTFFMFLTGAMAAAVGVLISIVLFSLITRFGRLIIFLSFVTEDKEFADELAMELRDIDFLVKTADDSVLIGQRVSEGLQKAVSNSDFVVLVLSKNAVDSQCIRNELVWAKKTGKTIFPVVIEDIKMPEELADVKFADFRKNREEATKQLISSLRKSHRSQHSNV